MRNSCGALVGAVLLFAGTSAQAVESKVREVSPQSVDAVWQKIGDFCGIASWHPAIAKCNLSADKKQRTLTLKNGAVIVERLLRWNDTRHSYTYRGVSGPLPIAHYVSTIRVTPNRAGKGSLITWSGHYDAKGASDADAKKIIDGIYAAGLKELAGH